MSDTRPAGQSRTDAKGDRANAEPAMSDARFRLGAVAPLRPSGVTGLRRLRPVPTSHANPPLNLICS
ncbi:hypothetical protein [Mycobacterium sp. AZCC_0083]|uniref:hypothetical protein n=1 Tax=Mycobacterium sp. AZCC_0083 TaxID=2735882 RepID=UPI001608845F|nr:hypothetical protein [Mycobacterium sp. AZCC_0083]MBB5160716.1 hypothetical protein [Mycobacterium sp. AZCC_0083]